MNDDTLLPNIIDKLEADIIRMWSTGEIIDTISKDPEYINLILLAVFHEKQYWQTIGLVVGDS